MRFLGAEVRKKQGNDGQWENRRHEEKEWVGGWEIATDERAPHCMESG